MYRHRVEPRVKLYSAREESFPIPLKYIDVTRTTHTNLDVEEEKFIDDCWKIGSRDLSDPWTGSTQFALLEGKVPDGHVWSGKRLTSKQFSSRQDHLSMSRVVEVNGKECQAERKARVVKKDSSRQRTKIAWNLFHRPRG